MTILVKEEVPSSNLETSSNRDENVHVTENKTESENNMLTKKIISSNGNKVNNKSGEGVVNTPVVDTSSYGPDNPIPSGTTPQDLGVIKIRKEQIDEYENVFAPRRYVLAGLLHVAGYNVLPCNDGEKYPYVKWTEYQTKRVTDTEIKSWINKKTKAMWISCGLISGNLQPPDFDQTSEGKRLFNEFVEAGKHLIEKYSLHFNNSGSGGKHCFLRVDSKQEYGGSALAFLPDPAEDKIEDGEFVPGYKCVTETRGERQGIMMPFSLYKFKRPPEFKDDPNYEDWYGYYWTPLSPQEFVDSIALVSEEDFLELKTIIKNTGVVVPAKKPNTKPPKDPSGKIVIPGSTEDMIGHFNKTNSIVDILDHYSAIAAKQGKERYTFVRHGRGNILQYAYTPPSSRGSITVNVETNTSWHFSSSDPLYTDGDDNPRKIPQTPFNIYCVFEHKGDVTAAVAELYREAGLAAAAERMQHLTENFEEAKTKKELEELKKAFEELKKLYDKLSSNGEPETPPVDEAIPPGSEDGPGKADDEDELLKTYLDSMKKLGAMESEDLLNAPPPEWLVDQVFAKHQVGMLFGHGNSGKTLTMFDLILSGITQRPFANKFKVNKKLNSIYCAGEGKGGLRDRWEAVLAKYGNPDVSNHFLMIPEVPNLLQRSDLNDLINIAMYRKPDMIYFDTLSKATLGASDSDDKSMKIAVDNALYLSKLVNCGVIFSHHTTKGDDYRGSTVLYDDTDFVIKVNKEPKATKGKISCFKSRDGYYWSDSQFEIYSPDPALASVTIKWDEHVGTNPTISSEPSESSRFEWARFKILKYLEKNTDKPYPARKLEELLDIEYKLINKVIAKELDKPEKDQQIKVTEYQFLDTEFKKMWSGQRATTRFYEYKFIDFDADDEDE